MNNKLTTPGPSTVPGRYLTCTLYLPCLFDRSGQLPSTARAPSGHRQNCLVLAQCLHSKENGRAYDLIGGGLRFSHVRVVGVRSTNAFANFRLSSMGMTMMMVVMMVVVDDMELPGIAVRPSSSSEFPVHVRDRVKSHGLSICQRCIRKWHASIIVSVEKRILFIHMSCQSNRNFIERIPVGMSVLCAVTGASLPRRSMGVSLAVVIFLLLSSALPQPRCMIL
jgi:hypothetical protein